MKKQKLIVVSVAIFVILALLQIQPWAHGLKPLGPSVAELQDALRAEEHAIHVELTHWRTIGKLRGYFRQDNGYELMVRDNKDFAEFDRRRKEVKSRVDAFYEKHPGLSGR